MALELNVAESPLVHVAGPSQTPAAVHTVLSGLLEVQTRSAAKIGDESAAAVIEAPRKRLNLDFMAKTRGGKLQYR